MADSEGGGSWHIPTSDESCHDSDDGGVDDGLLCPEPEPRSTHQQHDHFWEIEEWARLLNGALTPMERHTLENCNGPLYIRQDAKKLSLYYGKPAGTQAACKRMLVHFSKEENVKVGDQVPIKGLLFTLVKHMVLADRAGPKVQENRVSVGCSCFAASYLNIEGCQHKAYKLHKLGVLSDALCPQCSICLRCHKLPGYTWHRVQQLLAEVVVF